MRLAFKAFRRHYFWKTLFLFCIILLPASYFQLSHDYKGTQANVELFTSPSCPNVRSLTNELAPLMHQFQNAVTFRLYLIERFELSKEHREEETRQVCIQKYAPEHLLDYMVCRNKKSFLSTWEQCAGEQSINVGIVKRCSLSADGKRLISQAYQGSKRRSITNCPTLLINSQVTKSPLQKTFCQILSKHSECKKISSLFRKVSEKFK